MSNDRTTVPSVPCGKGGGGQHISAPTPDENIHLARAEVHVPPLPPYPPQKGAGYVYLLRCGPHVKIGYARDVRRRMVEINSCTPIPVEFVAAVPTDCARKLERYLHQHFVEYRTNGEWFELTDEQVREATENGFVPPKKQENVLEGGSSAGGTHGSVVHPTSPDERCRHEIVGGCWLCRKYEPEKWAVAV